MHDQDRRRAGKEAGSMTRAGEKLYGDWERRFDGPPRRPVRPWLLIVAVVIVAAVAAWTIG